MTSSSIRGETYRADKPCDKCGTFERYVSNRRCQHCHVMLRRTGTTEAQRKQAAERKRSTIKDKPVDQGMRKFTFRLRAFLPPCNVPADTLHNRFNSGRA